MVEDLKKQLILKASVKVPAMTFVLFILEFYDSVTHFRSFCVQPDKC